MGCLGEYVGSRGGPLQGHWRGVEYPGAIRGELRVLAVVRQTLPRSHLGRACGMACGRFGWYVMIRRAFVWLWISHDRAVGEGGRDTSVGQGGRSGKEDGVAKHEHYYRPSPLGFLWVSCLPYLGPNCSFTMIMQASPSMCPGVPLGYFCMRPWWVSSRSPRPLTTLRHITLRLIRPAPAARGAHRPHLLRRLVLSQRDGARQLQECSMHWTDEVVAYKMWSENELCVGVLVIPFAKP